MSENYSGEDYLLVDERKSHPNPPRKMLHSRVQKGIHSSSRPFMIALKFVRG